MSLVQVLTKKARYFVKLVIWLIITAIRASKKTMIMLESRMPGQLACPVWRGLGRNASQQWVDRAPLPPYITQLKGPEKWLYFYLYVILDIFSRYVAGWLIAEQESAKFAELLIAETCAKQGIQPNQLILHSDRGRPMKAKAVTQLLVDLGIIKSHSRPHVSDDNPFSEAQFKTLKYRPDYPDRFNDLGHARQWGRSVFSWYNDYHYHSALGLLTPASVHFGLAETILLQRQQVLQVAYATHPERFVKGMPVVPTPPKEVWINKPKSDTILVL